MFRDDSDRVSAQVRNLQQLVVSARRLTDVEDFVKNQMGKTTAAAKDWQRVGKDILDQLRTLREEAARLTTDEAERLRLRLRLADGWMKSVVGAYLFAKADQEMRKQKADSKKETTT